MKKGTLKQILLITDGCSNRGEDPAAVAALANQQGITVNVIGILEDDQSEQPEGLQEVEDVALSGGGVSQLVYKQALSQTVQMVTKQAMTQTLQGFVNKELKQILGSNESLEDLEPEKRGEIMEVVEDMGETSDLEVLVLLDTSASMHDKLPTVKEALIDLSISLNARIGRNRFCIFSFPGKRKDIQKVFDWSPELDAVTTIFPKLTSGGITPTGPAIREAMYQFGKKNLLRRFRDEDEPGMEEAGY
ncbi:Ca-activated chloride channel family protein [Virgibacillus natechei]|uniref:Ca-activated chloride channel family protein n=1 Tax=Virgibacillus natechei TaxID=1216297 RepID=A0ABS4IHG2_9BACI|nr:VWA domain-containing protein [Virgibacillus natechei]MBP1970383.1 Ca-activated chloride channel family protein [Virgibacillus natechei]UZD13204.1 VWA domain-containing protein [Virgibacillus natechei]